MSDKEEPEIETVQVSVKIPKQAYEFIKAYSTLAKIPIKEFIETSILRDLEALINDFDAPYLEWREIKKTWNLEKVFDC